MDKNRIENLLDDADKMHNNSKKSIQGVITTGISLFLAGMVYIGINYYKDTPKEIEKKVIESIKTNNYEKTEVYLTKLKEIVPKEDIKIIKEDKILEKIVELEEKAEEKYVPRAKDRMQYYKSQMKLVGEYIKQDKYKEAEQLLSKIKKESEKEKILLEYIK